ncbi:MAG TPA: TIGR03435 family protein [Bryobacteraceae bacterium]|nr:TIGR03435 family protein [Bryobacteraceae bacterium]
MRLLFALLIAALASAQQPAFEVASIKLSPPEGGGRMGTGMYTYPGGRVVVSNCPILYVIQQAFDEEKILTPDLPAWINEDRYDMDARPPANSKAAKSNPFSFKLPPNAEQQLMLQTLLADRFHMKFHRETKEDNVYLLVAGKSPKLTKSIDPDVYPWAGSIGGGGFNGDGLAGTNITMAQLVKRLTKIVGRPVLDQTGLTAAYDFKYAYASEGIEPADRVSSLIASLNALGLKLESSKAPIEAIVIDHIEKPTAN